MIKLTNEQLIELAREEVEFWRERDELIPSQQTAMRLRLAEIALAALTEGMEQEPVADVVAWSHQNSERVCDLRWRRHDVKPGPLYAAPQLPQPAVVPPEATEHNARMAVGFNRYMQAGYIDGWNACRTAMLQCAEPVNQPYTLPAEVCDIINRLLDSDGSRGTFSAVRSYDAREELERLLSAAPQQEDPQIKK
ncbi:MAG: hypothetical protein WAK61_08545 [Leclercia sp.]